MSKSKHQSVTHAMILELGLTLLRVSDLFPTAYLTERDFLPLTVAFLSGRVPGIQTEFGVENGDIDIRTKGPNPALIELAVAPRLLKDAKRPKLRFPGHGTPTQLYASCNKTELKKLFDQPQTKAKNRYLLLIDFQNSQTVGNLENLYRKELLTIGQRHGAVCVAYVSPDSQGKFTIRKTRKPRSAKNSTNSPKTKVICSQNPQ